MRASLVLMPLLAVAAAAQRRCGTTKVPPGLKATAKAFQRANARTEWVAQSYANRTITVETYFHVVASDETEENGYVPEDKLKKQYEVMNEHYKSTGVVFDLKNISWTVNKDWSSFSVDADDKTTEIAMKKTLRKGGYAALNVYFRPLGDGLLGICEFPDDFEPGTKDFWMDGCQVRHSSVPGGSTKNYDLGATATHEIGHWFGLFHTFQDGCDGGDQVDDTPAEADPTSGCPVGKDTCKGNKYPGLDPISNFMDYSYDSCLTQFTPGQSTRIFQMWDKYRAKAVGSTTPPTDTPTEPPTTTSAPPAETPTETVTKTPTSTSAAAATPTEPDSADDSDSDFSEPDPRADPWRRLNLAGFF
ncbi:Ulilysin [Orbilia brochopaga]|nr:Ulilysin [Drechslerella brochopaga]